MEGNSNDLCILPMGFEEFAGWYRELGKLKIFWAKKLNDVRLLSRERGSCLVEIEWIVRGRARRALMVIGRDPGEAAEELRRAEGGCGDVTRLVVVPEGSSSEVPPGADRRSAVYFWDPSSGTLEPNRRAEVLTLFNWGDRDLDVFRQIQKRSWGFFVPPREGDHVVVLAYLGGSPAGMAYLNRNNFNIDYGVHVVRGLWRRRIGTRVLREVLNLGRRLDAKYVSVVRVLRSVGISASDRRAISFYRANNPFLGLNVYRLAA